MNQLTEQQIKDNAAAYIAAKTGKPWQYFSKIEEKWTESGLDTIERNLELGYLCRPVPEPEPPQPWDCADDVPGPVCWIRICGEHRLVIAIDAEGPTIGCSLTGQTNTHIAWVEFGQQIAKWEHSTDRKEWKPCVKETK